MSSLRRIFDDSSLRGLLRFCSLHLSGIPALGLLFFQTFSFRLLAIAERLVFTPPRRGFRYFNARGKVISLSRGTDRIIIDVSAIRNLVTFPAVSSTPVSSSADSSAIRLATHRISCTQPIFTDAYADREDFMSAHRFVWLQVFMQEQGVNRKTLEFCADRIRDWRRTVTTETHPLAFETYSVCERLTSWLIFLRHAAGKLSIEPQEELELAESFSMQLTLIAANLEYNGSLTNNHICNNARALYVCGTMLGCRKAANLGRLILETETDRLVVNGVVQEDSSHYQMLITRWFIEIYDAAHRTDDTEMQEWLAPRLQMMLQQCNRLQSRTGSGWYPLFGDISPDIDPAWLAGFPFSQDTRTVSPWYTLCPCKLPEMTVSPVTSGGFFCQPAGHTADWLRLGNEACEVWVSAKTGIRCHGHNDSASIVAAYNGRPFLPDAGLENYCDNESVRFQVSVAAHNTPILDGLAPCFDRFSLYRYQSGGVTRLEQPTTDEALCHVVYLPGLLTLQRRITVDGNLLRLTDHLTKSPGSCRYEVYWLLEQQEAPVVALNGSAVGEAGSGGVLLSVKAPAGTECRSVKVRMFSTRYGECGEAWQVRIVAGLEEGSQIMYTFEQATAQ